MSWLYYVERLTSCLIVDVPPVFGGCRTVILHGIATIGVCDRIISERCHRATDGHTAIYIQRITYHVDWSCDGCHCTDNGHGNLFGNILDGNNLATGMRKNDIATSVGDFANLQLREDSLHADKQLIHYEIRMTIFVVGHHPSCIKWTVAVIVHRLDDVYIHPCQGNQRLVYPGISIQFGNVVRYGRTVSERIDGVGRIMDVQRPQNTERIFNGQRTKHLVTNLGDISHQLRTVLRIGKQTATRCRIFEECLQGTNTLKHSDPTLCGIIMRLAQILLLAIIRGDNIMRRSLCGIVVGNTCNVGIGIVRITEDEFGGDAQAVKYTTGDTFQERNGVFAG